MSTKGASRAEAVQIAIEGTLLGCDGEELKKGLWENGVYLGKDGFVYHITARQAQGGLQKTVAGKRAVGEYLRWVDGLFRPGELPSEANGIHYRAARNLRELIQRRLSPCSPGRQPFPHLGSQSLRCDQQCLAAKLDCCGAAIGRQTPSPGVTKDPGD